tara:strand:+ start:456 stop:704 length:249 start_codon:yes stop_codon:yes gene_type:complete
MNQNGPNIPILGIPKMRQYELQIPKNCTAEQLGIFLQGFVKSLGMGFAFTDDDFSQIHPKIRAWFVPEEEQDGTEEPNSLVD